MMQSKSMKIEKKYTSFMQLHTACVRVNCFDEIFLHNSGNRRYCELLWYRISQFAAEDSIRITRGYSAMASENRLAQTSEAYCGYVQARRRVAKGNVQNAESSAFQSYESQFRDRTTIAKARISIAINSNWKFAYSTDAQILYMQNILWVKY